MAKPPEGVNPPVPAGVNNSELATDIARRIESLVPKGQQAQVIAQVVSIVEQERFSGPIAHPRHLREYEAILPGSADRIVAMAENNLAHAQNMQTKVVEAEIADTKSGRAYGFVMLGGLIACALYCVSHGNNIGAGIFLAVGTLGAVAKLIDGKVRKPD